jgi:hypothetical protein
MRWRPLAVGVDAYAVALIATVTAMGRIRED